LKSDVATFEGVNRGRNLANYRNIVKSKFAVPRIKKTDSDLPKRRNFPQKEKSEAM
jgi:hypothetical protein